MAALLTCRYCDGVQKGCFPCDDETTPDGSKGRVLPLGRKFLLYYAKKGPRRKTIVLTRNIRKSGPAHRRTVHADDEGRDLSVGRGVVDRLRQVAEPGPRDGAEQLERRLGLEDLAPQGDAEDVGGGRLPLVVLRGRRVPARQDDGRDDDRQDQQRTPGLHPALLLVRMAEDTNLYGREPGAFA